MSNEYKDWKNDIQVIINGITYELKLLPDGWVKAFISDLRKELADAIGSYANDFEVFQIKEKYGVMRLYWGWKDRDYTSEEEIDLDDITTEVDEIISKYEKISKNTCVVCGKPATKMTTGWIMPVCDYCFENEE